MPSATHDGLVALFSNDPTLAARLLCARAGSPRLPAHDEVSVTRSDLGPPVPSDRRVDLALEFRHRRRRTAIVLLEVQLRPDPDKGWTWPNYYAAARDRWRCPVFLIVVTSQEFLARHKTPRCNQVFVAAYGGDVDVGFAAYRAFMLVNLRLQQERKEVEARVRQNMILELLADRNLRIPRIVRAEIRQCTDIRRLRTMLRRALRVKIAEDVLTRKRLPTAG